MLYYNQKEGRKTQQTRKELKGMMKWEERYELDRALEALMGEIENSNVTDEQFEEMGVIYDNADSWNDYNELEEMFLKYRG